MSVSKSYNDTKFIRLGEMAAFIISDSKLKKVKGCDRDKQYQTAPITFRGILCCESTKAEQLLAHSDLNGPFWTFLNKQLL